MSMHRWLGNTAKQGGSEAGHDAGGGGGSVGGGGAAAAGFFDEANEGNVAAGLPPCSDVPVVYGCMSSQCVAFLY